MQWMIWVWLAVIVISLIYEFISVSLTSFWFAVGGLVSLILAATGKVNLLWQIIVFILVSLIFLLSLRKFALKFLFRKNNEKTNTSALIGREALLIGEINQFDTGTVKLDGVEWTCTSVNPGETIPSGSVVKIEQIKGNKLYVSKIKKEN